MSPRRQVRTLEQISLHSLRIFIADTVHGVSKAVVSLEDEEQVASDEGEEGEGHSSQPGEWRKRRRILSDFIEQFGDFVMGCIPASLIDSAVDEVCLFFNTYIKMCVSHFIAGCSNVVFPTSLFMAFFRFSDFGRHRLLRFRETRVWQAAGRQQVHEQVHAGNVLHCRVYQHDRVPASLAAGLGKGCQDAEVNLLHINGKLIDRK